MQHGPKPWELKRGQNFEIDILQQGVQAAGG